MAGLKVGTEDRKKVAVAAALALVVLALALHTLLSGPATRSAQPGVGPTPVSALPAPAGVGRPSLRPASSAAGAAQLDPTLHPELMAENESFVYSGNGRNIFSLNSAPAELARVTIEKVKGAIRPQPVMAAAPAGPPPPPAIDLRFFGYAARRNGTRQAFLLHGDDVFIASEGDVVSHRYKVVRIAPTSVTVEDLPYSNTQSLPLVQN